MAQTPSTEIEEKTIETNPVLESDSTRQAFNELDTNQQAAIQEQVASLSPEQLAARVQTKPRELTQEGVEQIKSDMLINKPTQEQTDSLNQVVHPTPVDVPQEIKAVAPVKTEEPVQQAQEVKNQSLINEADETAIIEQKKQTNLTEFEKMVTSGATKEELASFALGSPDLNKDYNAILRNHFKTQENVSYVSKYSGMSTEQLYSAIKGGQVVQGSEQYNLLPEAQRRLVTQYRKEQDAINKQEPINFNTPENSYQDVQDIIATMYGQNTAQKVEDLKNDNRLVSLTGDANRKQAEIEKLDRTMISMQKRIEKENSGKLSNSTIRAMVRDENEAYQLDRIELLAEYRIIQGDIASVNADIDRDIRLLEYNDQQDKEKYQTALGLYESRRSEMKSEEQARFVEENKILAEKRQNDFTREMKKIDQQFTLDNKSPEYQTDVNGNIVAISGNIATPVMTTDGELVAVTKEKGYTDSIKYDADLGMMVTSRSYDDGRLPDFFTSDIGGNTSTNLSVFDSISSVKGVSKYTGKEGYYQCGEGVNKYLKEVGISDIWMGSKYEDKKQWVEKQGNKLTPQVGGLAVWNPPQGNGEGSEYGHVGIVTGFDSKTNTVEITDWNAQRDGKVEGEKDTYKIPVSQVVNSDGGFVHLSLDVGMGDYNINSEEYKQAQTIMGGTGTLSGLSVKMKEKVAPILEKLREDALAEGGILGEMKASAGGKTSTDSFRNSFEKGVSVISQIGNLGEQLFIKGGTIQDENGENLDLGPLTGWLRSKNPWDTDAATIQSSLTAIIPNLARGIYGEVGVLTNQDVELYKKTIPNLSQTEDVQKAVMALTMKTVRNSLDNKIRINAATGVNMAGLVPFYEEIDAKVKELESSIGIGVIDDSIDTGNDSGGGQSIIPGVYDWRKQYEEVESSLNVDYIFQN